jgi:hypothetical protein
MKLGIFHIANLIESSRKLHKAEYFYPPTYANIASASYATDRTNKRTKAAVNSSEASMLDTKQTTKAVAASSPFHPTPKSLIAREF